MNELSNAQLQVINSELVYDSLYNHIAYDHLKNNLFRHLAVHKQFNFYSKNLKTVNYLEHYLIYV